MDLIEGRRLTITGDEHALEGVLHVPEGAPPFPGVVICHPHPQYGGDMYNNVVGALVRASLGSGAAALRFNFRGVGGSGGTYSGGSGERDDVRVALACMRSQDEVEGPRIVLAGYSFGAAVSLAAAREEAMAGLILVSLPTVAPGVEPFEAPFPVLLASGDRDDYSVVADLDRFAEQLGAQTRLEVFKGVDHFWWGSDGRLIEVVSTFLQDCVR